MLRLLPFLTALVLATSVAAAPGRSDQAPGRGSAAVGLETARLHVEKGASSSAGAALRFRLARQIGAQIDLGIQTAPQGRLGRAGGHLVLIPADDRQYGLFLQVADLDDAPVWTADLGAEWIWTPDNGDRLALRAGFGIARPGELDHVFADLNWTRPLSDRLDLGIGLGLQEFDEADFRAIGAQARLALTYRLADLPIEMTLAVVHDHLTGFAPSRSLAIGFAYRFGAPAALAPAEPLAGLWSRGLVGN